MSYDQWKTTPPDFYEDEPEDDVTELERVYDDLREAQHTIRYLMKRIADLEAKYEPEIVF